MLYKPERYTKVPNMHELDLVSEDDLVKISFINRQDIWYAIVCEQCLSLPQQFPF